MKKILLSIILAGSLVIVGVGIARAVPMYYTFEGTVTVMADGAGIIANAGLELGSKVSYVFLIDFDQPGSYRRNNGEIGEFGEFYAAYISGSMLSEKDGGFYNAPSDIAEYNFGFYNWASFYTGSTNSNVYLAIFNSNILELGSLGRVSNTAWDAEGNYSQLDAQDLMLTEISPYLPVHSIENILTFFDESVDLGNLYARGTGWLSQLRLRIMRKLLEISGEFIEKDRLNIACFMLQRVYVLCDGELLPREDFVEGSATEELANMIEELMGYLECE